MAIVSLSVFEPGELGSIPLWRPFPKSDVASYGDMFKAVEKIAANCISKFATANSTLEAGSLNFVSDTGWDAVGKPT